MNPITDDDLVLYQYRDGLDAERIAQISAALAASPALRERYAAIERAVAHFGENEIAPAPELSARLWRRLEPQLEAAGIVASESRTAQTTSASEGGSRQTRTSMPSSAGVPARSLLDDLRTSVPAPRVPDHLRTDVPIRSLLDRLRAWLAAVPLRPAFAAAAVLVIAIGVGFLIGRQTATVLPPVASTESGSAAARVLEAYVAANLRATERVLLTASNSGDASLLEGNRELAQSLVDSNRLYAHAAARAGNTRLADFLRQLEPVLISLANQPGSAAVQSSEELRSFLDTTDLLFQVRATEARLDRNGKRRT